MFHVAYVLVFDLIVAAFIVKRIPLKPPTLVFNTIVLPKPRIVQVRSQWPYTTNSPGAPITTLELSDSSVTLPNGSSNALDLLAFQADTHQNSLRFTIRSSIMIRPTTSATTGSYVFLVGDPSINANWSTLVNGDIQTFDKKLSKAPFSIPVHGLEGPITLTTDKLASARFWSDEYDEPSAGHYLMQTFLKSDNAFLLSIGSLNNTFELHHDTVEGDFYIVNLSPASYVTPDSFLQNLRSALVESGIPTDDLEVDLQANDSEPLQISRLLWNNKTGKEYTFVLPDASKNRCATAVTLGLYEFDNESDATVSTNFIIEADLLNPKETVSKSSIIFQWPVVWTYHDIAVPGSSDADGFVIIDNSDSPYDSYSFIAGTHRVYGSTTFVSSINTFTTGTFQTNCKITFGSVAATQESQVLSIRELILHQNDVLDALFESEDILTIKFRGDSINLVSGKMRDFFSLEDGDLNTLGDALYVLNSESLPGSSVVGNIKETRDLVVDFVTSETIATINTTLSFGSSTDFITRYSEEDSNQWPSNFTINAFGAGGGSISGYFGGASGRAKVDVERLNDIFKLDIIVGRKGVIDSPRRATGGQATSVSINDINIMMIGGGGGAAIGSHGGQGGSSGLIQYGINNEYLGLSASLLPFDTTEENQLAGPTSKPDAIVGAGGGIQNPTEPGASIPINGLNGTYGPSALTGSLTGGTGGLGFSNGGTGSVDETNGQYFGGGGGGSTIVKNSTMADQNFRLLRLTMNPSWSQNKGPNGIPEDPPYGGGFGAKQVSYPWYEKVSYFSNSENILENVVQPYTNGLLTSIVKQIGGPDARLNAQSIADSLNGFTFPIQSDQVIQSYAPITPHDTSLPNGIAGFFLNGVPIHAPSLLGPNENKFTYETNVKVVSPNLLRVIYEEMSHTYFGDTYYNRIASKSLFFTMPPDSEIPTYIEDLWPGNNFTAISYIAPTRPIFQAIDSTPVSTESFGYSTNSEQTFIVPESKFIVIHAFGAGGTSSSVLKGSNGSYVRSTFVGLSGKTLAIYVGQGGGRPKQVNFGGLNASQTITLGGGLTKVSVQTSLGSDLLLLAGGGGSGGTTGDALEEGLDVNLKEYSPQINQLTPFSSAGGSGYRNGRSGLFGLGGTSGTSYIRGSNSKKLVGPFIKNGKHWTSPIGLGTSGAQQAGNGTVFIDVHY